MCLFSFDVDVLQLSQQYFVDRPNDLKMFGFLFFAIFVNQLIHPFYMVSPCSSPDFDSSYDYYTLNLVLRRCCLDVANFIECC